MARPSVLTPELRERIEVELADGIPVRIAAENAGISKSTLHAWISAGCVTRRPHLRLVESEPSTEEDLPEEEKIERAVIGSILKAASSDWRAAAWLAERRWPRKYARR